MCNNQSSICTCPEPYQNVRACVGCPLGWSRLGTNKCLLFDIDHSTDVTWYEAEKNCKILASQLMMINNLEEFIALQNFIEYSLSGDNELTAAFYFYHNTWVQINDG